MTTQTYVIQITQVGAQQTANAIAGISKQATAATATLAFFRKALVALSAVRAAESIIGFVDAAARIDNSLRASTKSVEDFARAQIFLQRISRETRTDVEANATTYARLLRATDSLGLSQDKLERIQEALSLSIKVGGATSMEARNALIQFSQSLASGALRGDELRSVAEQLPGLAAAIGKEFGITGGQLISFAKANPGILETERVLRGVEKALPSLREQFKLLTPTIAESFDVFRNALVKLFGDIQNSTGVFGALSSAIMLLADNLKTVIELSLVFAVAFAANKYGAAIVAIVNMSRAIALYAVGVRTATTAQWGLNAAMAANPAGAIITGITLLVTALIILYNNSETARTIMDAFASALGYVWDLAVSLATSIGGQLSPALSVLANLFSGLADAIAFLVDGFVLIYQWVVDSMNAYNQAQGAVQGFSFSIADLTMFMNLFGQALAVLITAVFAPFLILIDGIVAVMYMLGAATAQTSTAVHDFTMNFILMKDTFTVLAPVAEAAAVSIQRHNEATRGGTVANSGFTTSNDEVTGSLKRKTEATEEYYRIAGLETEQTITMAQYHENLAAINIDVASSFDTAGSAAGGYKNTISDLVNVSADLASSTSRLSGELDEVAESYERAADAANSYSRSAGGVGGPDGNAYTSTPGRAKRGTFTGFQAGQQGNYGFPQHSAYAKMFRDMVQPDYTEKMTSGVDAIINRFNEGLKTGSEKTGEQVAVKTAENTRPIVVNFVVNARDANSFRNTQDQINRSLTSAIQRSMVNQ